MNAARLLPWLVFAAALAGWEALVRLAQIPHYSGGFAACAVVSYRGLL